MSAGPRLPAGGAHRVPRLGGHRPLGFGAVAPLVIIPTYDEAENVVEVIQQVRASVPEAHVLIVDDNSPDGTADLAEEVGEQVGQVAVLRRA